MLAQSTELMTHKLTPPGLRPPDSVSHNKAGDEGSNLPQLFWLLFGSVAVLAVLVLIVLPMMVNKDPVAKAPSIHPSIQESGASIPPAALPVSIARNDAEQALKDFLRLRARPGLSNAERWAATDWVLAIKTAEEGDKLYGKGEFSRAFSSYKQATQMLQTLLDNRPQRQSEMLANAQQLLQQNDVENAVSSFERVLLMQPDSVPAAEGLVQARARNDVLLLMAEGSQAEQKKDWQQAGRAYRSATQRDVAYLPAREALTRVTKSLADEQYQQAMGTALDSLDRGRLRSAEKALESAAAFYPDNAAVNDLRRRLAEAKRRVRIAALLNEAEQKTAAEKWQAVENLYRKVLVIDERSVPARNGLTYAIKRKQLNALYDHYLGDTARLSSDEPLANAQELLQTNKQIPAGEKRLAAKHARLKESVRLAMIPVKLQIRSDGKTDIAIYHVGRLGRFQEKRLSLRPGTYTLTGSCNGYRDVRKIITLRPGAEKNSVAIRCEELI